MYTRSYKIAGMMIGITSIYWDVHEMCKAYAAEGPVDFEVCIAQADIAYERDRSRRENALEGLPVREYPDWYLETLAVYRKVAERMLQQDTLLFHGSAIAVDGEAVLFTAKSGTGKSTHTRLWRETFGRRAFMVNDDKPLLRVQQDGVLVCGTPWDGKHRLSTNCEVPLKAICILQRGETNEIRKITAKEALPMLMQQSFHPTAPAARVKQLQVLNALAQKVQFYCLRCNMEPEAVQVAYEAMFGK